MGKRGFEIIPTLFPEKEKTLHSKLVDVAYKWVTKNAGCGVAFKEFHSHATNGEFPDVIGFGGWNHSVLIECKATKTDFYSDRKKEFRKNPELGMGRKRYYCCPTDLISISELPPQWGLIYVNAEMKARCIYDPFKGYKSVNLHKQNIEAERNLMYSALRRLQIRNRIEEIYLTPDN